MTFINDSKQYTDFGENIFKYLNKRGWNLLSKKELVTILIHYGIESKLIPQDNIHNMARKLKIKPSTIRRILEDRALIMNRVENWGLKELQEWLCQADQTTTEDHKKGKGVYFLRDWLQRLSVETFLESMGIIPDYKNNKQLLVLDINNLVLSLSRFKEIDIVDLVKTILEKNTISHYKLKEAELKANPTGILKDIIKEQASTQIGMKTTETISTLLGVALGNVE